MVLPIVAYGDPVLRKETETITKDFPRLDELIENMFETMYDARGIGLAAPQIGEPIRLFVVDATPFEDDDDLSEAEQKFVADFKRVFINPRMLEETGDEWAFNEGCLSIPEVREDVFRQRNIVLEYEDENFKKHKESFNGIVARIIQHEYDHIEGILFTDKLSPLKKRLIKGKLANISKGNISVDYRMKFPNAKKKR
ncbi:peptide deformylase [Aequorivita sp. SDUM287046]|uniref:Peptide deformylase n=1 Tax=Aequorivita aurantiaca TaxID=3053356 RepID=A0ABT8DJM7_9FLAO|nr:peptide deformylase [Aequorivita aurantiaca]MDN3725024.1 peptide deformylase [Aequorivita aurantiaca]